MPREEEIYYAGRIAGLTHKVLDCRKEFEVNRSFDLLVHTWMEWKGEVYLDALYEVRKYLEAACKPKPKKVISLEWM
jgi:hypothetical protein